MSKLAIEEKDLLGLPVKARVMIHNVRYPSKGHSSGDWAIVIFDVLKVLEGSLYNTSQMICTGNMPSLREGAYYVVEAKLVKSREHGYQHELISMRFDYDLSDEGDKKIFLTMFTSEKIAESLLAGQYNPIDLLENKNITELTKIKGIGSITAAKLCARYEENKDHSRAYIALSGLGLTKYIIDKLILQYKSPDILIDKIEENPYILIKEVKGFGWIKCDQIAMAKGFTKNCRERVEAYIQYYLYMQAENNGNSWVSIEDLLLAVSAECSPIPNETLVAWVKENIIRTQAFEEYYKKVSTGQQCEPLKEMPLLYYDKEKRRIGLLEYRILELEITRHFKRLIEAKSKFKYDKEVCEKIIKDVEKEQGYEYTPEQLEAVWKILDSNVSALTGLAGSGKSSTIAAVSRVFEHYHQTIEQCALSGRASSKLSELTHRPGKTIHRTLCYLPDEGKFSFTENRPLPADVVILDETSMVGGELFLYLIRAIKSGAKFIMVGDVHQLESIGMCNIFKDCLKSGYIPSSILTKIHRQAAKSGIISQSLKMSQGEQVVKNEFSGEEIRGELKDFKIISTFDADLVSPKIITEFKRFLQMGIKSSDIQVIVPMRTRGAISCRVLNEIIQGIVNPGESNKDIVVDFNDNDIKYKVRFKPNDKIIVCKNNYHALGVDGLEKAIFNGNVGFIKDTSEDYIMISLPEQGDILLDKDEWTNIQLAYAITVHKKQGDSVPYAIVGLNESCYALYSKELLYTAVTRARKFCTLVTTPRSVNTAVKRSKVTLKQTWLIDELTKLYIAEQVKKEDY